MQMWVRLVLVCCGLGWVQGRMIGGTKDLWHVQCGKTRLTIPTPDEGYTTTSEVKNTVGKDGKPILNVHLVPHSHDDPGWIKTVDQYFYGSKLSLNTAGVAYELDTVVDELMKNPHRKFMFVEQSFFQRWWNEQSHKVQQKVRLLIRNGQLDLTVNGGWCMHDEATTHYTAMLDQTAFGHRFLHEEFNITAKIGWQIDPFGHSSTHASLLSAGLGFDALYFTRIDYQDYEKRKREKELEFIWRGTSSLGAKSEVFTGVIQNHYGAPSGFEFEQDDPICDDKRLHDVNVCERVDEFVKMSIDRGQWTKDNHIFLPMGDDFQYKNALVWYKNMDKLMHYVNQDARIHVLYSNLSYYTEQKHKKNITWSVKTDDFFPYADGPHAYWTGYFTSRPTLKGFARLGNQFLRAVRQLESLYGLHSLDLMKATSLDALTAAVGLVQHHDGITGTERQAVAYDYEQRIWEGVLQAERQANMVFAFMNGEADSSVSGYDFCWLRNISICATTQTNKRFEVLIYNPLSKVRTIYLNIPIDTNQVSVLHSDGKPLNTTSYHVVPTLPLPVYAASNTTVSSKYQLILEANALPPLGRTRFTIVQLKPTNHLDRLQYAHSSDHEDKIIMENNYLKIEICARQGSIRSMTRKFPKQLNKSPLTVNLTSDFAYYHSYQHSGQKSGAYMFRTEDNFTYPMGEAKLLRSDKSKSGNIHQVQFQIGNASTVKYELNAEDTTLNLQWTVGPISVEDNQGKEVIVRFNSSIASKATWYTDSNGYHYMERKRNYRPSWNVLVDEAVAGNYFPITTGVFIRDEKAQLSILTDRGQGAGSLKDGSLEIMVHRRLTMDDQRGVEQSLNETESDIRNASIFHGLTARGNMYLSLEEPENAEAHIALLSESIFSPPLAGFRAVASNSLKPSMVSMALKKALPPQIFLLSYDLIMSNYLETVLLVRLVHQVPTSDQLLGYPVTLDFKDLIVEHYANIVIKEVSLSGTDTQPRSRLQWKSETPASAFRSIPVFNGTRLTIQPMEIRTFRVMVQKTQLAAIE